MPKFCEEIFISQNLEFLLFISFIYIYIYIKAIIKYKAYTSYNKKNEIKIVYTIVSV